MVFTFVDDFSNDNLAIQASVFLFTFINNNPLKCEKLFYLKNMHNCIIIGPDQITTATLRRNSHTHLSPNSLTSRFGVRHNRPQNLCGRPLYPF